MSDMQTVSFMLFRLFIAVFNSLESKIIRFLDHVEYIIDHYFPLK